MLGELQGLNLHADHLRQPLNEQGHMTDVTLPASQEIGIFTQRWMFCDNRIINCLGSDPIVCNEF